MLGVSERGRTTAVQGHAVEFCGPHREPSWELALEWILSRLDADNNRCFRVAEVALNDDRVQHLLSNSQCNVMRDAYKNVPLSCEPQAVRGLRLQQIARRVYA